MSTFSSSDGFRTPRNASPSMTNGLHERRHRVAVRAHSKKRRRSATISSTTSTVPSRYVQDSKTRRSRRMLRDPRGMINGALRPSLHSVMSLAHSEQRGLLRRVRCNTYISIRQIRCTKSKTRYSSESGDSGEHLSLGEAVCTSLIMIGNVDLVTVATAQPR